MSKEEKEKHIKELQEILDKIHKLAPESFYDKMLMEVGEGVSAPLMQNQAVSITAKHIFHSIIGRTLVTGYLALNGCILGALIWSCGIRFNNTVDKVIAIYGDTLDNQVLACTLVFLAMFCFSIYDTFVRKVLMERMGSDSIFEDSKESILVKQGTIMKQQADLQRQMATLINKQL